MPWLAGAANITATLGSIQGAATLTVDAITLQSIQVSDAAGGSIAAGTGDQFVATADYSDGSSQDVTDSVRWKSSNSGIAVIDDTGQATGIAPGIVSISASLDSVSGSAPLTVTSATCSSVSVLPSSATVAAGNSQAFTAQCNMSDGTTQDVTASVLWNSSDSTVATIDDSGLALGVAQGAATITADFITQDGADVQGSAVLNVTPSQGWVINIVLTRTVDFPGTGIAAVLATPGGAGATSEITTTGIGTAETVTGSISVTAAEGVSYTISVPPPQPVSAWCTVVSGAQGTLGDFMPTAFVLCQ